MKRVMDQLYWYSSSPFKRQLAEEKKLSIEYVLPNLSAADFLIKLLLNTMSIKALKIISVVNN